MVARRLLIILMVLLGVSALAALSAPRRGDDDREQATTKTTPETTPPPRATKHRGGTLFKVKVDADSDLVAVVGAGDFVLRVGDELALQVSSRESDDVEIPGFGVIEPVARDGPANFDLLFEHPGSYEVRLVNADRTIARIEVSEARPE